MAEIFQGQVIPFPPNPGSYVALAADVYGTAIEVYPNGSELVPGEDESQAGFRLTQQTTRYTPFHAAISVPISLEEIERIGDLEGWRVLFANRDGLFDVVEFWVENQLMFELLTPAMAAKYQAVLNPEHLPALIEQFTLVEARS
jgi:hypothetical protein